MPKGGKETPITREVIYSITDYDQLMGFLNQGAITSPELANALADQGLRLQAQAARRNPAVLAMYSGGDPGSVENWANARSAMCSNPDGRKTFYKEIFEQGCEQIKNGESLTIPMEQSAQILQMLDPEIKLEVPQPA